VNSYDSDGRLKSVETDKESYIDRDTEYYTWTDRDAPPNIPPPDYARQVQPFGPNNLRTSTQISRNGNVMMLKSSEISSTPMVHWSGENSQHLVSQSNPNPMPIRNGAVSLQKSIAGAQLPPHLVNADPQLDLGDMVVSHTVQTGPASHEVEYKRKEDMDGSKWSRTEETLWISSANKPRINPSMAIMYGMQDGGDGKKFVQQNNHDNGDMSIEERRKMRRNASRAMTAYSGRDY